MGRDPSVTSSKRGKQQGTDKLAFSHLWAQLGFGPQRRPLDKITQRSAESGAEVCVIRHCNALLREPPMALPDHRGRQRRWHL